MVGVNKMNTIWSEKLASSSAGNSLVSYRDPAFDWPKIRVVHYVRYVGVD